MADGCCNFARLSLFLSATSLILLCFGVFNKCWWETDENASLTVFTVVNCDNLGYCRQGRSANDGWVTFTQASGVLAVMLSAVVIIAIMVYMKTEKSLVFYISIATLSITVFASLLHTFVLIVVFSHLKGGDHVASASHPEQVLKFQTLPVGLVATGSSLCLLSVVCLIIHRLKLKKEQFTKAKQNRVV